MSPEQRSFYEILLHEQPCHLYVDVDMNREQNHNVDTAREARLQELFLAECTQFLVELGFVATREDVRVITLDSSRGQKLSRHFIIKCPTACFTNNYHCGAFLRRVRNRLMRKHGTDTEKNPFFVWATEKRKGKGEGGGKVWVRRFYADLAVYTKRRNMRVLYSSKASGAPRPLLVEGRSPDSPLSRHDFEDCLVQRIAELDKVVPRDCLEEDGSTPRNTNSLTLFRPDLAAPAPASASISAVHSIGSAVLRKHYESVYPFASLFELFGCKGREWVFQGRGGHWNRYLFFDSAEKLKQLALERLPAVIHIGPVYAPGRDATDRRVVLSRELVFDIDLNDYGDLRGCCGAEKKACAKCWKYAQFCMRVLDRFLRDYGFHHILFVFSGAKGLHCWVCDAAARKLSQGARQTLVRDLHIAEMDLSDTGSGGGVELDQKRSYVCDALRDRGGTASCKRFLREEQGLRSHFDKLSTIWGDEAAVLHFLWPRIDVNVTTGMSHPTKSPFALNPKTGRASRVLRSDASENPFVRDDNDNDNDNDNEGDQILKSVAQFSHFVRKIHE